MNIAGFMEMIPSRQQRTCRKCVLRFFYCFTYWRPLKLFMPLQLRRSYLSISPKSMKLLWAASAGRCSFPECSKRLCITNTDTSLPHLLGEMAHIKGEKNKALRHDDTQTQKQRNDYENLILLCRHHHGQIDTPENIDLFPVEVLHEMKRAHETAVFNIMEPVSLNTRLETAEFILPLLYDNQTAWNKYGPTSDLARLNPHCESSHAVWVSEKLSTLIPNNRIISNALTKARKNFRPSDQKPISLFLQHVNSYENLVLSPTLYTTVTRFPESFMNMIEDITDGSI